MAINTSHSHISLPEQTHPLPQATSNRQAQRRSMERTVSLLAKKLLGISHKKPQLSFLSNRREQCEQYYREQMKDKLKKCKQDIKSATKELKQKLKNGHQQKDIALLKEHIEKLKTDKKWYKYKNQTIFQKSTIEKQTVKSLNLKTKPEEKNGRKYENHHHFIFSGDDKPELLLDVDGLMGEIKSSRKGVNRQTTNINIYKMDKEQEKMKSLLANIPRGDDLPANTQHTKISLDAHGDIGGLIIVKQDNATSVIPDKKFEDARDHFIPLITNALKPGNYGNKLTISVQNCYGASAESSAFFTKDSTLRTLAKSLAKKGVVGVRLTGTSVANAVNGDGSFMAIKSESDQNGNPIKTTIKSAASGFKEEIVIKADKSLAIKNSQVE